MKPNFSPRTVDVSVRRRGLRMILVAIAAGFAFQSPAVAQIKVTSSAKAPVPGTADQSYLPGRVDEANTLSNGDNSGSGSNDNLTYIAHDQPSKGMSFTTGSNLKGYKLNAITVQHVHWNTLIENGTYYNVQNGNTLNFRFGKIAGTVLTPTLTTTATYSGDGISGGGDTGTDTFFTFDLSDANTQKTIGTLAPNTTYFFEITSETDTAFFELNSTATKGYTGGAAFYGDKNGALATDKTALFPSSGGCFAFDASLTAITR